MKLRIRDAFSHEGATELKHLIENYWAKRGHIVKCKVSQLTVNGTREGRKGQTIVERYSAWVVTSDMINGLPRGIYEAKSPYVRSEPPYYPPDSYIFC